jgi:hypothetical protein
MKKIFILAILIRLICLYLFRNVTNYDLQSYLQVGELTLKGVNIYPTIANLHHPYLPFFLYVEGVAVYLGQSKIIVITIIKFINIIFDLGILYLVYLLSKKNLRTAFLYAINPITILITTLHGQFDVIPVFFVLLTLYLIKVKKDFGVVISFSFAILLKTWPVIFLIPIVRNIRNRKILFLLALFPIVFTLIYCFFYKTNPLEIGKTLISYQGLYGIWGPLILLGKQRIFFQKLLTIIFLISFFTYSYVNMEKDIVKNILKLLFFFFVFTTNFSIQYFVWIIPFLILIKPRNYLFLITLMTFYLISLYYVWLFCLNCRIVPNWLLISQNIVGFILWFSFIKIGYISSK